MISPNGFELLTHYQGLKNKKLLQSKERDKHTGFDRINVVEDYQRSRIRASQVEKSTTREKPYIIASMSAASSGIPRAD